MLKNRNRLPSKAVQEQKLLAKPEVSQATSEQKAKKDSDVIREYFLGIRKFPLDQN